MEKITCGYRLCYDRYQAVPGYKLGRQNFVYSQIRMDWKCDYTNTLGSERIGLQYVDGTLDNWSIFLWVPITISQPWLKRCLAIAKKYLTKWVPFICHGWIVCWWLKSMFVFKLWLFCFYPDHHNVFFFKYRFFKPTFYILFTLSLSIINPVYTCILIRYCTCLHISPCRLIALG